MTPVEPTKMYGGHLTIFARETDDPVPASVNNDGTVILEFDLTEDEREILFSGGRLRLFFWKPPAAPMPPISLTVTEHEEVL